MASFKAILYKPKQDGSARVVIQMLHKRAKKIIPTEIYIEAKDLNKSGEIKSKSIRDEIDEIIVNFRIKVRSLPYQAATMSAAQLYDYITGQSSEKHIDFIAYARNIIDQMRAEGRKGTARNYNAAINSLISFLGYDSIDINHITAKLMYDYSAWLASADSRNFRHSKQKIGSRAVSLYTGIFRALINRAKAEFNDEDAGIIPVRVSPFVKYKVPSQPVPVKRALSLSEIRSIIHYDISDCNHRTRLGRDMFLLSFYMLGTNSVDIYNFSPPVKNRITYQRAKTRTRRTDHAEISILLIPEAAEILRRYEKNGKYIFRRMYSTHDTFNAAINKGLKTLAQATGVADLSFYAARHSWATIAVNDCEIDKYIVHQALNHADPVMRVTDMYIRRDWSLIDRANRKVIDYVLISG